MTNTVGEVLRRVSTRMEGAGVDHARGNAEQMLCHVLGVDRFSLYLDPQVPMAVSARERVDRFVERRVEGEPLQYIVGEVDFLGLPLWVRPGVLIPRPETEVLALEAERLLEGHRGPVVLDAGCGSGAIACHLGRRVPGIRVIAVDRSPDAVRCTVDNLGRSEISAPAVVCADFQALPIAPGTLDLVVSNPPYIATDDLPHLQVEVIGHEPRLALDGGADGLDAIRALVDASVVLLKPGGSLALEVGAGQAATVASYLEHRVGSPRVVRDLAGIDRVVTATRPSREGARSDG